MKTTGVVEHTFVVKTAEFRGLNWKVRFTVLTVMKFCERGARSMMLGVQKISGTHGLLSLMTVRSLPGSIGMHTYSVSVNAIIFLAPISTFDQVLAEVSCFHPEENSHLNRFKGSPCESPGRLPATVEIDRLQQTAMQRQHSVVLEQMRLTAG